jgi:hypothetical protein
LTSPVAIPVAIFSAPISNKPMPDRHAHRRAGAYRARARELAQAAAHEWRDEGRRQHMLDLAKSYERTADAMAPPSPRKMLIEHLRERGEQAFTKKPNCLDGRDTDALSRQ